jgi:hypothetical protein
MPESFDPNRFVRQAIDLLVPSVEARYGPLPPYRVRPDYTRKGFNGNFQVLLDPDWRGPSICYHSAKVAQRLHSHSKFALLLAIIHELLHVIHAELGRQKAGLSWSQQARQLERDSQPYHEGLVDDPNFPLVRFTYWAEGSASLLEMMLATEMITDGRMSRVLAVRSMTFSRSWP